MKSYRSLHRRIVLLFTGIGLLSLLIIILFLGFWTQKQLLEILDENSRNILESTNIHIENLNRNISYNKNAMLERRKLEVKNHVSFGYTIVENYWTLYKNGTIDEVTAKEGALSILWNMKNDSPGEYFWVINTEEPSSRLIMHPFYMEYQGVSIDQLGESIGFSGSQEIVDSVVKLALENGEGFVSYRWPDPENLEKPDYQEKLSYLRYFAPWDMIIITGLYLDDIDNYIELQKKSIIKNLNLLIPQQRIGENGYIFIFDDDYRILVHPNIAGIDGRNLINPATGNTLFDEFIESVKTENGEHEYLWEKPGFEGKFQFKKKSHTIYHKELGWYISSTIYMDDGAERVSNLLKSMAFISIILIFITFISSFLVSRNISNQLSVIIRAIQITDSSGIPREHVPDSRFKEIHLLCKVINNMVDSIKSSRAALKEERDFSFRIISGAPYIICSVNPEGVTTFINSRGEDISGYSQEEVQNRNWAGFFFPQETQPVQESIFKDLENGEILDRELRLTTKSGDIKTLIWSSLVRRNVADSISEIILFGKDITAIRMAEDAQKESEKRARLLLSIIPDLLFIMDREGVFLDYESINREFYIGYDFHQKSITEIMPPDIAELTIKKIAEALTSGKATEYIYSLSSPEKGKEFFEARMIPSGENQVLTIVRDVSENKRMEEMMVQSEKMLSVGGLAAGMAHEINNPLAGILQTANVLSARLKDSSLPANIKAAEKAGTNVTAIHNFMEDRGIFRMLNNISESGVRIAEIVGNMLSFARKSEESISSYHIPELMDKTLELAATDFDLKKHYDFKKIKIQKEYSGNLPLIPCQSGKIQQVFLNILSNSAQALQTDSIENPTITLRIYSNARNEKIIIEIEDNGPGIPEHIKNRIFEPFFTTKPVGTGTGLGLSVSYFIIRENHGGEMSIKSPPGKGATFIITLPIERGR